MRGFPEAHRGSGANPPPCSQNHIPLSSPSAMGPGQGPESHCITWAWPLGTNGCIWISFCTFVLCGGFLLFNEAFHITTDFFFKGEKGVIWVK